MQACYLTKPMPTEDRSFKLYVTELMGCQVTFVGCRAKKVGNS